MIRRFCFLIPLALLATAAAAAPPAAADADEEVICVGGAQWRPSLEDAGAIQAVPVPASYRALFESTAPCTRWALDEASLVDWHFRFGSEPSATAALAYLVQDYRRDLPGPDRYLAALRQAFRAALPDLRRTAALRQPEGLDYSVQDRFMESRPRIRRLKVVLRYRENYLFLTQQYLRAAEEFGSGALLGRAEIHARAFADANAFLAPVEAQPPVAGLLYFNLHTFVLDDLKTRIAVLKAGLTHSPSDVEAARAILSAQELPIYPRIAETAYSGGDDFCDISEGWSRSEEIAAACREDDDMQAKVINYWTSRALFDFISPPEGNEQEQTRSLQLATRLLQIEQSPDHSGRCCGRSASEDMLRLHLAQARYERRRLIDPGHSESGRTEQDDQPSQIWWNALNALQQAERLARPYEAPQRFQRIATSWLDIWDRSDSLFPAGEDSYRPQESQSHRRYAEYLRANLVAINGIAVGGSSRN